MHTSHCSLGESRNHCKTSCETCSHHSQFHCSSSHGSCQEKEDTNELDGYRYLSRKWEADSPVEIHEEETVNIDLPPLSWQRYSCTPKFLCVTNTGRTVLINGQWSHGRPFLKGGPLNGNYIFSQIHFHCPSEHQIGGVRYPLEMHVVHYKTSYLTQERAMHEKDGTVVLAYLFKVVNSSSTVLSNITNLAHELGKVSSRKETKNVPLEQLVKPFTSNYYVYWGSVSTEKNSYLLQWIINCNCLYVTKEEVDSMLWIMSCGGSSAPCESKRMKPENNVVYRVGEDEVCMCNSKTKSVGEFRKAVQVEEGKSCSHISSSRWTTKPSCRRLSLCSISSKEKRKKCMDSKHSDTNTVSEATNTTPAVSTCHVNETTPDKVTCETQTEEYICGNNRESKEEKKKEEAEKKHPENKEDEEGKKDTAKTSSEEKQASKREQEEMKKTKKEVKKLEKKSNEKFKKSKSSKSLKSEKQKSVTKANNEGEVERKPSDIKIKTIFQKKGTKKPEKAEKLEKAEKSEKIEKTETTDQLNSDVQVNFLLTPNTVHSISSNTALVRDSEMDKEDAENAEKQEPVKREVLVNTATNSRPELPSDKPKQQVKDLCLQMEHIFHSDNKEGNLSSYICQEYHVAIEYDNKVIQEYSGMFQPFNLLLGSSERLKVLSKYQDPKDLQVRLQDCTVKLESLDRLRVRTTFSVNESAFLANLPNFKLGLGGIKEKKEKLKKTLDAETQCTIQDVIPNENLTALENYKPFELGMRPPGELISINQFTDQETAEKGNDYSTVFNQKRKFEETNSKPRRKPEEEDYFTFEREPIQKRECKIKLLKNPEIYKEDADSLSIDSPYQTDEAEEWKEQNIKERSKSDMRLKHSLSKYKKTVYFMYDRIERDVNTGKKIFVGSFRTKEEIKNLSKQKKGLSNEKSYGAVEEPHKKREENGSVIGGEISEEIVRIYGPGEEIKSEVDEPEETKSLNEKKGLVTLHKFRPKQPMNRNLIIGKVLNHLKEDTGKLVHLTGIIGVEKRNKTKNLPSELAGSGCENSNLGCVNFREDEKSEKENLRPQMEEGLKLEKTLEGKRASSILGELPSSKEMLTTPAEEEEKSQKLLETKDGQGAIIVIPVEVESLSKIELILIEHVEDVKKEKNSNEYIPCLNFYKRLVFHLKVYFYFTKLKSIELGFDQH